MKKFSQFSLLLALVLSFSSYSHAALLVEPVVGFNFAKLEIGDATEPAAVEGESYKGTGGAFGGRLGYQNLGFQLGVDYLRSSIDLDDNDFDENLVLNEWAGFVGFEFPVLVRVYAGYIFSAQGETESDGDKVKLSKGSGTKFGVGFTGLPFIDINFEYRIGSFDEFKSGSSEFNSDVDYSSFMIGLSLPLTF